MLRECGDGCRPAVDSHVVGLLSNLECEHGILQPGSGAKILLLGLCVAFTQWNASLLPQSPSLSLSQLL